MLLICFTSQRRWFLVQSPGAAISKVSVSHEIQVTSLILILISTNHCSLPLPRLKYSPLFVPFISYFPRSYSASPCGSASLLPLMWPFKPKSCLQSSTCLQNVSSTPKTFNHHVLASAAIFPAPFPFQVSAQNY